MSEKRKFESENTPEALRKFLEKMAQTVCNDKEIRVEFVESKGREYVFKVSHTSVKKFFLELKLSAEIKAPFAEKLEGLKEAVFEEYDRTLKKTNEEMARALERTNTPAPTEKLRDDFKEKVKKIAKKLDSRLSAKVMHVAEEKGKPAESEWYVMFEYEGLGEIKVDPISKKDYFENLTGEFPVQLTEKYMNDRLEKDFEQYYRNFLSNQKPKLN